MIAPKIVLKEQYLKGLIKEELNYRDLIFICYYDDQQAFGYSQFGKKPKEFFRLKFMVKYGCKGIYMKETFYPLHEFKEIENNL
jgi:hypothetical protein